MLCLWVGDEPPPHWPLYAKLAVAISLQLVVRGWLCPTTVAPRQRQPNNLPSDWGQSQTMRRWERLKRQCAENNWVMVQERHEMCHWPELGSRWVMALPSCRTGSPREWGHLDLQGPDPGSATNKWGGFEKGNRVSWSNVFSPLP